MLFFPSCAKSSYFVVDSTPSCGESRKKKIIPHEKGELQKSQKYVAHAIPFRTPHVLMSGFSQSAEKTVSNATASVCKAGVLSELGDGVARYVAFYVHQIRPFGACYYFYR